MKENVVQAYGNLCSTFYDATENFASVQEVDFFASWIKRYPGNVLEAMSGSGRLQIPLMQRGYVIDGVDCSGAMITRCYERCKKLNLAQPTVYQQSLQNLVLVDTYTIVIIAFGSLQLISDKKNLMQSLKNIHKHMAVGAHLLLDIFVPDITINQFSQTTVRLDEHKVISVARRHMFDQKQKLATTFSLFELFVDGIVQQQENELLEIVWYSDDEWQDILLDAGFELVDIYEEFFNQQEKSRIIHARSVDKSHI